MPCDADKSKAVFVITGISRFLVTNPAMKDNEKVSDSAIAGAFLGFAPDN